MLVRVTNFTSENLRGLVPFYYSVQTPNWLRKIQCTVPTGLSLLYRVTQRSAFGCVLG